jgi:hypothetical protein
MSAPDHFLGSTTIGGPIVGWFERRLVLVTGRPAGLPWLPPVGIDQLAKTTPELLITQQDGVYFSPLPHLYGNRIAWYREGLKYY